MNGVSISQHCGLEDSRQLPKLSAKEAMSRVASGASEALGSCQALITDE